jgi:hypothetical protein
MSANDRPIFPRSPESDPEQNRKQLWMAREHLEKEERNFSQNKPNLDNGVSYCPMCGAENRLGAKFCQKCGSNYDLSSLIEVSAPQQPSKPMPPKPVMFGDEEEEEVHSTMYGPPPVRMEEQYNPFPVMQPPAYGPPPMALNQNQSFPVPNQPISQENIPAPAYGPAPMPVPVKNNTWLWLLIGGLGLFFILSAIAIAVVFVFFLNK